LTNSIDFETMIDDLYSLEKQKPENSAVQLSILFRNKHLMALKSDIFRKDYLFWISPVIILVLLFFAIRRDNRNRDSVILNSGDVRADSSITMVVPNKIPPPILP
jgi:hypothetical protein